MRTIQQRWGFFARETLPAGMTPAHREAIRMAFYAGAGSTLTLVMEIFGDDVQEDASAMMFSNLMQEVNDFANTMEAGT